MKRKIIKIDEEKCNGCGLCAQACDEGAIVIIDGKAKLLRDDYCDGLGNCLPACPEDAIILEEREAVAYDEEAVKENLRRKQEEAPSCGCSGSHVKMIQRKAQGERTSPKVLPHSRLRQWPVQIKLAPVNAPYFHNARLLIAADCTAYAYGAFHEKFMKDHITLIGCPKLDDGDYSEKLTAIIKNNAIRSLRVVRMEVPCCGGIERAVVTALRNSGKMIPWQVITLSADGKILD
ncbi:MAG: 4Fe-4S binding protein [Peptoniphilus sp.]|nr:4Fe-4S binding protein [Peptoniphilus sp.]